MPIFRTRPGADPVSATRSLVLTLAALCLLALPAAAQEDITGKWIFSVESPDGAGMMEVPFVFEQDGTTVTGTVDLSVIPQVESAVIEEGELVDGVLFFFLLVSAEGEWITAEVEAEVDGDEMVGEVYLPDMGQFSPFTARRADG